MSTNSPVTTGPVTVTLPKDATHPQAKQEAGAKIDPALMQAVLNKYAEMNGKPAGESAQQLGVQVADAGATSDNKGENYLVLDVGGGNGSTAGQAGGPPPASPAPIKSLPGFEKAVTAFRQPPPPSDPNAGLNSLVSFGVNSWMNNPNIDVNALIQAVLAEAYQGNTEDLHAFAKKVQFYNNFKKELRNRENAARSHEAANIDPKGGPNLTKPFITGQDPVGTYVGSEKVTFSPHTDGGTPPKAQPTITTQNALEDYIKNTDQTLQSASDDSQLAQLQLQTMTQNQQQLVQTMSDLSKKANDTIMAITRNIAG
jgi:hypothetical protein